MIITLDLVLKYGGIAYGLGATYFVAKQQVNILKQKNELSNFKYKVQELLKKLDDKVDSRFDKVEQDLILKNVERDTKIAVLERDSKSASGWISKLYNCMLFNDTISPEYTEIEGDEPV